MSEVIDMAGLPDVLSLRVVFYREGDWWIARGVEYNVAAQAHTVSDLAFEFERVIMTHVLINTREGKPPFFGVPRGAPDALVQWERGMVALPDRPHFTARSAMPPVRIEARVA